MQLRLAYQLRRHLLTVNHSHRIRSDLIQAREGNILGYMHDRIWLGRVDFGNGNLQQRLGASFPISDKVEGRIEGIQCWSVCIRIVKSSCLIDHHRVLGRVEILNCVEGERAAVDVVLGEMGNSDVHTWAWSVRSRCVEEQYSHEQRNQQDDQG